MEYLKPGDIRDQPNKILCCQCGALIDPNPANMCVACVRSNVDITEAIPKQATISYCKACERFLQPPAQWIKCELESRELLGLCLKRLKGLNKVRLVDAGFIWTEAHSKKIKIKLTVQAEVMGGAVLQQVFSVDFTMLSQMCDDCRRLDAKDYWKSVVQVRQKVEHRKTLYYLEQLVLKYRAHKDTTGVKPHHDGLDFFYGNEQGSRKMVEFLLQMVPCRYNTSKKLISHDTHNNTYNYKFTFSVELVPICKDSVVCLPPKLAHQLGGISPICVCYRVTNTVHLIDPNTAQVAELNASTFWRSPFKTLSSSRNLVEFIVIEVEPIYYHGKFCGQGSISSKHKPADVYVTKANAMGEAPIHCRTFLGHILNPGDSVLGIDLKNSNINDDNLDKLKKEEVPDVVLVKKHYPDQKQKRRWKLRHLIKRVETDSAEGDYDQFLQDLEEDPTYRQKVNIFKDRARLPIESETTDDEDRPKISLQEMMDDLTLSEADDENNWIDVEMEQ